MADRGHARAGAHHLGDLAHVLMKLHSSFLKRLDRTTTPCWAATGPKADDQVR